MNHKIRIAFGTALIALYSGLLFGGCGHIESYREVESQIFDNASNACSQAETTNGTTP